MASWTCLALVFPVLLGCGARSALEGSADDEDELPECTANLEPRTEDCARVSADAVPLARITGDGTHLAADDAFLYYTSDGNVFRLAMDGGEPEALTPGGLHGHSIKHADGFVYWVTYDDVLHRVPASGGEPESLLELAHGAAWAVAGEDILHGGPLEEPSPLHRTSLLTGETNELLAEDPQRIHALGVADDRALVSLGDSLVSVPLDGGAPQLLATGAMHGAPLAHDGDTYFGASFAEGDHFNFGILRVDMDEPSTPELVLRAFPLGFTMDDDALYGHVLPGHEVPGEKLPGSIVRLPLAGGQPQHITYTDAVREAGFVGWSKGLLVSGCNVYFIDRCDDTVGVEFRLVTMSKVPGARR